MNNQIILVLDVGTTNIKCIAFDETAKIISQVSRDIGCISEDARKIEYDPILIWETVKDLLARSLEGGGYRKEDVICLGISTQRGSMLLWDRISGLPESFAISWQDLRAVDICQRIMGGPVGDLIVERMGSPLVPMKSLGRLIWLFEERPHLRKKAENGEVFFGNIDSWILWKLTGREVHATDCSNASATHMVNLFSQEWDEEVLSRLNIPINILPSIKMSSGNLGFTDSSVTGREIPICSLIADQQGSLFGQGCVNPSMAKCTYGTGSFILVNIGERAVPSAKAAWNIGGQITYAVEGYGGTTGLMTRWLLEEVFGIHDISKSEKMASCIPNSQGVFVVPAFSGLQAPFQDPRATGVILGIKVGVTKEHIIRALLESVCMLCRAIVEDLQMDPMVQIDRLRVDGAGAANDFMVQFQSDILGIPIERSAVKESTAAGSAFLAGLACDVWSMEEIPGLWKCDRIFKPKMNEQKREEMYNQWIKAVGVSRAWGRS